MRGVRPESELAGAYVVARYTARFAGAPATLTFDGCAGAGARADDLPRGAWAIVAAANPWSVSLDAAANAARSRALRADLDAARVRWSDARNSAPDGAWAEDSFLVEGVGRDGVLSLCRRYGQAACVLGAGRKCGLLWTRSERWVVLGARLLLDAA